MTSTENLMGRALEYLPQDKLELVQDAYRFAEQAHQGQKRVSGEPFVEHPLQTALYLAELRLDSNAIAAALLHDVMEDCGIAFEELDRQFGSEVAMLVDGVTKLTKVELLPVPSSETQRPSYSDDLARAETLRKMLTYMAQDIRVVLIKLADRMHNMKTLSALPKNRRLSIAQETLDIYAPLAHRIGIWEMKWRLEDMAFLYLNPEVYHEISHLLSAKREERETYIEKVISLLQEEFVAAGIKGQITGRPKHIYSIHKKMQTYASQNKEVGDIYDLFAIRVLVEEVRDCYLALGVVHSKWHPLPGQFDDYIANPKDNLYQSLHTAVLCEDASPVEVQIRTDEMHRLAEYGVAAHWLYKEGQPSDMGFEGKMTWLRQLLEWQRGVSGAEEFVESFKSDVFQNQVFVYTPKGELKEMPAGATPLDFAFRIHTDIGHHTIGAKVNEKLVPLHYELNNGDTVEILTSKTVTGPNPDWLNANPLYIKTGSAREKVRQWLNRQTKNANIERGRSIFEEQIRRVNTSLDDLEVTKRMEFQTTDELFLSMGSGYVSAEQVINTLASQQIKPQEEGGVRRSVGPGSGVEILGVGDLITRMARCCTPIRGDDIVGNITRTRGVTVHRSACHNVGRDDGSEGLIQVRWGKTQTLYPVRIRLEALDRVGLLRDITSLVSEERVNIAEIVSREEEDISIISLTVYIDGIDQLGRLFSKLEGVQGVVRVDRASSLKV